MKVGPVTKLDKRNKTTLKRFDDEVILVNCDIIVIFSIYGQFGAIRKPDYVKLRFSLTVSLCLTKTEKKN